MKQQSPYIQAYEAGVKLATAQYFGKLANAEEEERAMLMEQYETADSADQEAIAQQILELENSARGESAETDYRYGPGEGNKVIDSDPQSTYLDEGYDLESLLSEPSTQGNMAATLGRDQPSYLSSFLGGDIPTTQTPPITRNRPLTPAEQVLQGATSRTLQGATPRTLQENMSDQFEREQEQKALNTFSVGTGGYGRQLSRFRKQFGQGNKDLFSGKDAINYRDFAKAMDNRALQVGDTFDARDVLNRLRESRGQRGPAAKPFTGPRPGVGIQRRGRDVSRFQTLGQQRNAANAKSNSKLPKMETNLGLTPSKFEGSVIPSTRLNKIQNQPAY